MEFEYEIAIVDLDLVNLGGLRGVQDIVVVVQGQPLLVINVVKYALLLPVQA